MAVKRKTVEPEEPEVEEEDMEEEDEEEEGEEEEEDDENGDQDESEEDKIAREEEELTSKRRKELKTMPAEKIKEAAQSKEVALGKKEAMIDAILEAEAAERAGIRSHNAKIREAILEKKKEFEDLPLPELKKTCARGGITDGIATKQACVEQLMKRWQEEDGIDKAVAKMANDARDKELRSMDSESLRNLCESAGIDPFVKEIMVDRVVRHEHMRGAFAKPGEKDVATEDDAPTAGKKLDMVDSLLAKEAKRKQEKELEKQREDAEEQLFKEVRGLSVDELKKQLTKRGQDVAGKKDELMNALFALRKKESAISARKTDLKAMGIDKLKSLATSKGLDCGKRDEMIDAILDQEAKTEDKVKFFEEKLIEVLASKKEELEGKTAAELKELCNSQNLKPGVGKEVHLERLLEFEKASGNLDKMVSNLNRKLRYQELLNVDHSSLLSLCASAGVDPVVKEVMIERALMHEREFGRIKEGVAEPPRKKARGKK